MARCQPYMQLLYPYTLYPKILSTFSADGRIFTHRHINIFLEYIYIHKYICTQHYGSLMI